MLSALFIGRLPLTSGEVSTGTRWIEGSVSPEVVLDNFEQNEIPHLYRESKDYFLSQPVA